VSPMLTVQQVALRLQCSPGQVYRHITSGRLVASKVSGWRIDPDDLQSFIESTRVAPQSSARPVDEIAAIVAAMPVRRFA
jgi:excisionase family DNA binding protein